MHSFSVLNPTNPQIWWVIFTFISSYLTIILPSFHPISSITQKFDPVICILIIAPISSISRLSISASLGIPRHGCTFKCPWNNENQFSIDSIDFPCFYMIYIFKQQVKKRNTSLSKPRNICGISFRSMRSGWAIHSYNWKIIGRQRKCNQCQL